MSYESPIELLIADIQHQIVEQQDEQIYQAVMEVIPNINREELLKALKYDRDQYDRGYEDGKRDAVVHARWEWRDLIGDGCSLMLCCSNCLETRGARETAKFCPECGAKMDADSPVEECE